VALDWWEQQLGNNGAEAKSAREYLEKREITEETRKAFHLGYAPDSWNRSRLTCDRKGRRNLKSNAAVW